MSETRVPVATLLTAEKKKLRYEYDFGDGWAHTVTLEKIVPYDPALPYPVCIAGKNACPPEDCGGAWGYASLLEALADPAHPEHDDMVEWLEGDFDPAKFDIEAANRRLTPKRR